MLRVHFAPGDPRGPVRDIDANQLVTTQAGGLQFSRVEVRRVLNPATAQFETQLSNAQVVAVLAPGWIEVENLDLEEEPAELAAIGGNATIGGSP